MVVYVHVKHLFRVCLVGYGRAKDNINGAVLPSGVHAGVLVGKMVRKITTVLYHF